MVSFRTCSGRHARLRQRIVDDLALIPDDGTDDVVAIASALTAKGIEVFEPDFDLDDAHMYSAECSAILYYFGEEPYGKVYYDIKTGKDLSHACLARGIYLKQGVKLKNPTTKAVIIEANETNGFKEDTLSPFYTAIGAAH